VVYILPEVRPIRSVFTAYGGELSDAPSAAASLP
jgi:hypothetical protein